MPRVKRGVTARARHKKVLALAKGYRGRRKNVFRIAKQAVMRAGQEEAGPRQARNRSRTGPRRRDDGAVRQIQSHHGRSPRWRGEGSAFGRFPQVESF